MIMNKLFPFPFPYNLDDEEEVYRFIKEFGTARGRRLANLLGWTGPNSTISAYAVSNYAWSKSTAIACRKRGAVVEALVYEAICDKIYKEDLTHVDKW